MSLSMAFFTLLNAFFVSMFFALPFSVEYEKEDAQEKPAIEGYRAAPKAINWKKAVKIAFAIAVLVTLALKVIIMIADGR